MPLTTLIALVVLSTLTAFAAQTPGQSVLGDLPRDRIDAVMRDLNRALDIECVHCHVDNEWKDESKPAFATARNMLRMVRTLNEGPLKDVGEVQCWTCHRGNVKPARLPSEALDAEIIELRVPRALREVLQHLTAMRDRSGRLVNRLGLEWQRALGPGFTACERPLRSCPEALETDRVARTDVIDVALSRGPHVAPPFRPSPAHRRQAPAAAAP
jgi:hypothetical protein